MSEHSQKDGTVSYPIFGLTGEGTVPVKNGDAAERLALMLCTAFGANILPFPPTAEEQQIQSPDTHSDEQTN